jgi:transcriptional regulator with XRE-family HTH domain
MTKKYVIAEDTKKRLGQQVSSSRHEHRWTLDDLGRRCGRPAPRISDIETGKANSTLQSLSEIGAALDLELIFVPRQKLNEVLALSTGTDVTKRAYQNVNSVFDELFIPDSSDDEDVPSLKPDNGRP